MTEVWAAVPYSDSAHRFFYSHSAPLRRRLPEARVMGMTRATSACIPVPAVGSLDLLAVTLDRDFKVSQGVST